jgi:hypothetical protein
VAENEIGKLSAFFTFRTQRQLPPPPSSLALLPISSPAVAGIRGAHHVLGVEGLLCELCDAQGAVVLGSRACLLKKRVRWQSVQG